MAKADVFENNEGGIKCVYKNDKWLVSIKNWKPDNDVSGIAHLEIHHESDEQFIVSAGRAILITADYGDGGITDLTLTEMEQGKVYNVPKEMWFYTITQKNTKMMYVQDAGTSMDNSSFADLSKEQIGYIQKTAQKIFSK